MKYIQFKKFDSYLSWYNDNKNIYIEKVIMKFRKNKNDVIKVWFTTK